MMLWEHAYRIMEAKGIPPCSKMYINTKIEWVYIPYWHQIVSSKRKERK